MADLAEFKMSADDVGAVIALHPELGNPNLGIYYDAERETLVVPTRIAPTVQQGLSNLKGGQKLRLVSYALAALKRVQARGTTVSGVAVETDEETVMTIVSEHVMNEHVEHGETVDKTILIGKDGMVHEFDATKLFEAVVAYMRDCRRKFTDIKQGIERGTITTEKQIDDAY